MDAAFLRIMRLLLAEGTYPAIATHDPAMIDATRAFARERASVRDRFEFQMLYGIRRDLQASLTREGLRVRVYVPFGREWFPYFMRRLGERPANIGFVIRGVLRERYTARRHVAATERPAAVVVAVESADDRRGLQFTRLLGPKVRVIPRYFSPRKLFCSAWHIS